jgi:hypothetical protein
MAGRQGIPWLMSIPEPDVVERADWLPGRGWHDALSIDVCSICRPAVMSVT